MTHAAHCSQTSHGSGSSSCDTQHAALLTTSADISVGHDINIGATLNVGGHELLGVGAEVVLDLGHDCCCG